VACHPDSRARNMQPSYGPQCTGRMPLPRVDVLWKYHIFFYCYYVRIATQRALWTLCLESFSRGVFKTPADFWWNPSRLQRRCCGVFVTPTKVLWSHLASNSKPTIMKRLQSKKTNFKKSPTQKNEFPFDSTALWKPRRLHGFFRLHACQ
jgi:hypothetical protein